MTKSDRETLAMLLYFESLDEDEMKAEEEDDDID